jgi:hypothetical protein
MRGRRSLAKRKCRWVYNVKVDIKEEGSKNVDWIQMVSNGEK